MWAKGRTSSFVFRPDLSSVTSGSQLLLPCGGIHWKPGWAALWVSLSGAASQEPLDTDWTKLGHQPGDIPDLSCLHSWLISTSLLAVFQQQTNAPFFSVGRPWPWQRGMPAVHMPHYASSSCFEARAKRGVHCGDGFIQSSPPPGQALMAHITPRSSVKNRMWHCLPPWGPGCADLVYLPW